MVDFAAVWTDFHVVPIVNEQSLPVRLPPRLGVGFSAFLRLFCRYESPISCMKYRCPFLPLLLAVSITAVSAKAAPVTQLKVLSFNIWVQGGLSLSNCIEVIRTSGADLVGLQECNGTNRDHFISS